MSFQDLTGMRFSRLVVKVRVANKVNKSGKPVAQWLCVCDCGNEKVVRSASLNNGSVRSCGCLRNETAAANARRFNVKHGLSNTRIYGIWAKMLCRCYCTTNKDYAKYGVRGILVCQDWLDFNKFYEWAMRNGYQDTLSLDRVDNDGIYSPQNCRWATLKQQANNTRQTIKITFQGETKSIAQWAETLGLPAERLYKRRERGCAPELILSLRRLRGGERTLSSST
jgi:hypothetical protein